jgi:hypothetical protein
MSRCTSRFFVGDYKGLATAGNEFVPTWAMPHRTDPNSVFLRRIIHTERPARHQHEPAKIVLSSGESLFGGLAEPLDGLSLVIALRFRCAQSIPHANPRTSVTRP